MASALSMPGGALTDPAGPATVVPEVARILDAAWKLFSEVGTRRTTIGDVARQAGIDRVTVYRRVGNKDDVVQAVVGREALTVFTTVARAARAGGTFAERIELGFSSMMRLVRGNPMLNRMISLEADTVLLQLTTEGADLLRVATSATLTVFEEAVQDGLLATTEGMASKAELLVRIVHSFMLTPTALITLDTDHQLRAFAREHLVPMLLHDL